MSGVSSAGFTTCEQPAASAGASLRAIIASGKFHGVIATVAPMGSRKTSTRRSATRDAGSSPAATSAAAAAFSKKLAAYSTSPRLSTIGFPLSLVKSAASCAPFERIPAANRRTSSTRLSVESTRISRVAAAFASAARVASAALAPTMVASGASVAGFTTTSGVASPATNSPAT